eukprot:213604-Chlamydomonas_euryale.AAC.9
MSFAAVRKSFAARRARICPSLLQHGGLGGGPASNPAWCGKGLAQAAKARAPLPYFTLSAATVNGFRSSYQNANFRSHDDSRKPFDVDAVGDNNPCHEICAKQHFAHAQPT